MAKKTKTTLPAAPSVPSLLAADDEVSLQELWTVIEAARGEVARAVNSAVVLLNWNVGQRIRVCRVPEGHA